MTEGKLLHVYVIENYYRRLGGSFDYSHIRDVDIGKWSQERIYGFVNQGFTVFHGVVNEPEGKLEELIDQIVRQVKERPLTKIVPQRKIEKKKARAYK